MKRIILSLILIVGICFILLSCKKDDTDDDNTKDDNTSYVTLIMDGTSYDFSNVGPCTIINGQYIQFTAYAKDINNDDISMRITISGTEVRAYDESEAIIEIDKYQAGGIAVSNGSYVELHITETSPDLIGTFSAIAFQVMTPDPPSVVITNGVIHIKNEDILRY